MPTPPIDTSLGGYTSGSVDGQNDIYRNRQRPRPYPLVQNDSGYDSADPLKLESFQPSSSSLLSLANFVKCNEILQNESNFASETKIECYQNDSRSIKRHCLDEQDFHGCLTSSVADGPAEPEHRILIFFNFLHLAEMATYRAQTSFSKAAVEALISVSKANVHFVPDLLGRPNYWAPELYCKYDDDGRLESLDFSCQQPRFAIHSPNFVQKFPVSIHMRYNALRNVTYYIISGPESDEGILNFQNLLNLASDTPTFALLQHPLEAHILISKIFCESSQGYINLFRQSMFAQLRAVDELSVQESANRKRLADVTIELQIISKDVNKLIGDVEVATRNLAKLQEALSLFCHPRNRVSNTSPLHPMTPSSPSSAPPQHQILRQMTETLQYLHSSMDKQKMWLQSYRDRKDIAMSLVFNLVTQQDAANNIGIAKSMKQDSSSMNGIALLTMVFLPGTFTSTILGAGIFSAYVQNREIRVSGLWWFWAAITFPLTGAVLLLWIIFCWRKEFYDRWIRPIINRRKASDNEHNLEAKG